MHDAWLGSEDVSYGADNEGRVWNDVLSWTHVGAPCVVKHRSVLTPEELQVSSSPFYIAKRFSLRRGHQSLSDHPIIAYVMGMSAICKIWDIDMAHVD